jgi:hypothetical protein
MKAALMLMSAPLLAVGTAQAQEAPQQAPPMQQQAPTAPAEVADDEVARFALAALVIEQIAADETMAQDQQQSAMMEVVTQAGLEPQRYNQIATASQSDTQLQQRIQAAADQHIAAAQQNQATQNQ